MPGTSPGMTNFTIAADSIGYISALWHATEKLLQLPNGMRERLKRS
jgi:hypothetical protein